MGGAEAVPSITAIDKLVLAVSNFGVYGCIASFILHGPILYTTYLGGTPQAIGTIGVIMGFFNAVSDKNLMVDGTRARYAK